MTDRRPIDQVPTEELERILAIRKRKERAQALAPVGGAGTHRVGGPARAAIAGAERRPTHI